MLELPSKDECNCVLMYIMYTVLQLHKKLSRGEGRDSLTLSSARSEKEKNILPSFERRMCEILTSSDSVKPSLYSTVYP